MAAPRQPQAGQPHAGQPQAGKSAKSGVKPGATSNTDKTRAPDRPVQEEDVFGGVERTGKGRDVKSDATKP